MTIELEQEFFKAFGIKPNITGCNTGFYDFYRGFRYSCDATNCKKCKSAKKEYPEITDRKLLEMICIVTKYKNVYRFVNGIEDLKKQTLKILISLKDMLIIYAEIQQLFKGEE